MDLWCFAAYLFKILPGYEKCITYWYLLLLYRAVTSWDSFPWLSIDISASLQGAGPKKLLEPRWVCVGISGVETRARHLAGTTRIWKGNHTGHRKEILLLAVHRKDIYKSTLHYVHCNTWVGITLRNVSETCVQLNSLLTYFVPSKSFCVYR